MNPLGEFAQKWCHPDHPPQRVESEALVNAERKLGVLLPEDYKLAILAVGLPHPTLALLHNLNKAPVDLHDLSALLTPLEIETSTQGWRKAGLPSSLITIGSDCMGSSFCFDERDLRAERVLSAPVYFWDHDLDETERVSISFNEWIRGYLESWSLGLGYKDF